MISKSMHEMDTKELEEFIAKQENVVARLKDERAGTPAHNFEGGILLEAKELLAEKRRKNEPSDEPHFVNRKAPVLPIQQPSRY